MHQILTGMKKLLLIPILTGFLVFTASARDIRQLIDAAKYPGASLVTVFDSTRVQMEPSGLSHVYTHRLVKILTAAGAKSMNVIRYDYDPQSAYTAIHGVTVYRANGDVIRLDTGKVMDYPQPARAIYWGAREKMIEVGRLEPGDAVEVFQYRKGFTYALLQEGDDDRYAPPMRGHFYDIVPFWSSDPVLLKYYSVSVPSDKVLQYEVYNGEVSSGLWRESDRIVYSFWKKDMAPWKGESRSVDASDIAPKLLLSTSPDWKAKSLWFYGVNEDYGSFKTTPEITAKVKELLRNCRTEFDSVSVLTHWAGDEIRYLGLHMGKGEGYTLHTGQMDFTDRLGVCKDKAGMLITMLRAAGFEAYPAMTMAGSRIDYIPADQFNHCVTVVKSRRDGRYHLLDPTWVPFVRELWSSAEQQQNYLMGVPEGADLAETAVSNPENHYLRISGMSTILADGTLEGEYTVTAEGQTDASIRGMFTRAYVADWAMNAEKEALKISPLAQVERVYYEDPYRYLDGPIQVHYRIRIPDYATVTGSEIIFTPLLAGGFFKRAQPHLGFETGNDSRTYPFRDRTSHTVELNETVNLEHIREAAYLPEAGRGDGSGASWSGHYKLEKDALIFSFSAAFPKRIYDPGDWPSFRSAVIYQQKLAESPVIVRKQ